jgi:antitoxin MazE
MTTIVQKWGNSLALRIPSAFAKDIHLHQGSAVEVAIVEGNMVVKPSKKQKPSLARLLKGVTAQNLHAEQDYGRKAGRETW